MNTMHLKNSQQNVDSTDNSLLNFDKNTEIFKTIDIPNTPFVVIHDIENKQYFGCMGNARLTEFYDNLEETITTTKEIKWERIIQVITILTGMKV